MKLNLKIAHRGLLLVGVPLLLELAFVGVLTYLLQQAEAEIKREAHAKDVIRWVYKLQKDMFDCITSAGGYNLSRQTYYDEILRERQKSVENDVLALEQLLAGDPEQARRMETTRKIVEYGIGLTSELKEGESDAPTLRALVGTGQRFANMRGLIERLGMHTNGIVAKEQAVAAASPGLQMQQRDGIRNVLYAGVVLNIALAICLAIFFSRSITQRLRVMMDNSLRVARGQELHPVVPGGDEIAALDRTFHEMVQGLRESEKLKQQLMATVSHDLKSPLTSVQAALTLLSAGVLGELSPQAQKKVETAEDDVGRLIKLINDLLDLERVSAGRIKLDTAQVPAQRLVKRAVDSMRELAEQRGIEIVVAGDSSYVLGDEDRLVQVLVNLLSNAVKFSPEGSEITVSNQVDGDFVKFTVSDQGRGVPENMREKIFERFEQVKASDATESGGTGLGLAICKSIIEAHGGQIGVQSRGPDGGGSTSASAGTTSPGSTPASAGTASPGSTFWFTVPLAAVPLAEADWSLKSHERDTKKSPPLNKL